MLMGSKTWWVTFQVFYCCWVTHNIHDGEASGVLGYTHTNVVVAVGRGRACAGGAPGGLQADGGLVGDGHRRVGRVDGGSTGRGQRLGRRRGRQLELEAELSSQLGQIEAELSRLEQLEADLSTLDELETELSR